MDYLFQRAMSLDGTIKQANIELPQVSLSRGMMEDHSNKGISLNVHDYPN
jgi:hypothetical protein